MGDACAQGRFDVFEEHLYTEMVTSVLRHAITSLGVWVTEDAEAKRAKNEDSVVVP